LPLAPVFPDVRDFAPAALVDFREPVCFVSPPFPPRPPEDTELRGPVPGAAFADFFAGFFGDDFGLGGFRSAMTLYVVD